MPWRAGLPACALAALLCVGAAADETLLGCRAIESNSERLACYDRTLDRLSEELTPERSPEVARTPAPAEPQALERAPGEAAAAEPDGLRERLFGRSTSSTEETLRSAYGIDKATSLVEEVGSVRRMADRQFEVRLVNGQVWRQTDAASFWVRPGDRVEIKSGAFGAYYMNRVDEGRSVRVTRVN